MAYNFYSGFNEEHPKQKHCYSPTTNNNIYTIHTLVQLSFICNSKTTHCFYIDNNTLSSTYLLLKL